MAIAVAVRLITGVTLARIWRTVSRVGRLVGSIALVFVAVAVGLAVAVDSTVSVRVTVVVALAVATSAIPGVTLAPI